MTFGSLFAGLGGIDLGFERAGLECKWQVEIDDYATRVLEKHWPRVHRERDIRECGSHNLKPVDVIAGGFPCQDISYAGRGAGLEGERSGLFFEAVRLVRELRPRFVVLENVAALLNRGLDRVLGALAEIGFDAEWHCVPAAAVGAPHIRDRTFVLAYSTNNWSGWREQQSQSGNETRHVANPESKRLQGCGSESLARGPELSLSTLRGGGSNAGGDHWKVEPDVGRVAHGIPKRVDRLRGLGNAVVPQVAEVIGRWLMNAGGVA